MSRYFYHFGAIAIFPIWTVCSFVSGNLSELILWQPLLVMTAGIFGVGVIVFLALSPFLSTERRAGLAAAVSAALSVLFMMNLFREALRAANLYSHTMLFAVSVLAIVAATILAFVCIRNVRRLRGYVLVGGIMAAIAIWPIAVHVIGLDRTNKASSGVATGSPAVAPILAGRDLPNVYYLIIDAYGRADALRKYVGFDNSAFMAHLGGLGFQTLGNARSNYMKTHMSIPSTLAMDYLFTSEGTKIQKWDDIWNIMKGDNAVVRRFHELGYRYVFAGGAEWCSNRTDGCIKPPGIWSKATWQLAHNTPIPGVMSYALPTVYQAIFTDQWRFEMADVTAQIGDIVDSNPGKPLFFLYHELAVHDSSYNADCSLRKDLGAEQIEKVDDAERMAASTNAFAGTVTCANTKLNALVNRILERDPNALVVLTADHGSSFSPHAEGDTSAKALTGTDYVDERTAILSSWKLPEICREKLPDNLSLVNNFRFVFSCITGQPRDLLANRHFAHEPSPRFDVLEVFPD